MIELGAVSPPPILEAALDSVLFKRLTTHERLVSYLNAVRKPGLTGVAPVAALLSERDPAQAPAESFFETKFYRFLRRKYGKLVKYQHEVYDGHGLIGRIDAAFPEKNIGVEAHSLRWHSPRDRVRRDAERHNRLAAAGWRMLYETFDTLNKRPGEVLERLDRLLAA